MVGRVYPAQKLCDEVECHVFADGKVLYRDSNHLSIAGSEFIAVLFERPLLLANRENETISSLDSKEK